MMMTFDAAVAGYLHRTERPTPRSRRQEEDALDGLSGWLHSTLGTVPLDAVTPQLVARYAAERRLSSEALDDLRGTLAGLSLWARDGRAPPADPPSLRTRTWADFSRVGA
ncbi:MAG TPA: hypothetical protein VHG08_16090 [Longimicrobium sp.]|nr:hypothetical protein [Longimicrobium sp.]